MAEDFAPAPVPDSRDITVLRRAASGAPRVTWSPPPSTPWSILRMPDPAARHAAMEEFVHDLRVAAAQLEERSSR